MKIKERPYTSNGYMWTGVSAIFFSSCVTVSHSHNTMQLIFDIQDQFKCRIRNGPWKPYKNLIINENVIHQLDTNSSVQLLIYLDVDTEVARAIKKRFHLVDLYAPDLNIFDFVGVDELEKYLVNSDPAFLKILIQNILQKLSCEVIHQIEDERIWLVKRIIVLSDPHELSINFISSRVHLSQSKLR